MMKSGVLIQFCNRAGLWRVYESGVMVGGKDHPRTMLQEE